MEYWGEILPCVTAPSLEVFLDVPVQLRAVSGAFGYQTCALRCWSGVFLHGGNVLGRRRCRAGWSLHPPGCFAL